MEESYFDGSTVKVEESCARDDAPSVGWYSKSILVARPECYCICTFIRNSSPVRKSKQKGVN